MNAPQGSQAPTGCTCGQPRTENVLHRTSGPCLPIAVTSQPASLDAEYGELRALAAKASSGDNSWPFYVNQFRKAVTPSIVLSILDSRAQLVERVAVLEAALSDCVVILKRMDTLRHISSEFPALDRAEKLIANTTPHPHADEAAKVEAVPLRAALMALDGQLVAILNGADGSFYRKLKAARNDLVRIWLPLPAAPSSPAEGEL